MRNIILIIFFSWSLVLVTNAQEMHYKSGEKKRIILPGQGQEFSEPFIPVDKFFFVQFGVYQDDNQSPHQIKAPGGIGQVWLIHHSGTKVSGQQEGGAFYIVQPFTSSQKAIDAVQTYKDEGIECWFNPGLTGVSFQLVSATSDTGAQLAPIEKG